MSKRHEIAVKAALTGHLVLSTLHTNDAPGTVNRLVNMGIEPFLVASAVNLICAQRLVRRVCSGCSMPQTLSGHALLEAGFEAGDLARAAPQKGTGCERCNQTGYRGRIGLYEVMEVTDSVRDLVLAGAPAQELRRTAIEEGMVTLRRSGLQKVMNGIDDDRGSCAGDGEIKGLGDRDSGLGTRGWGWSWAGSWRRYTNC